MSNKQKPCEKSGRFNNKEDKILPRQKMVFQILTRIDDNLVLRS